ncbi:MAG: VanW family protein [Actinomycetes bacterium]
MENPDLKNLIKDLNSLSSARRDDSESLDKKNSARFNFLFIVFYLITFIFILVSISTIPPRTKLFDQDISLKISATAYEEINQYVQNKINSKIEIQTPDGTVLIDPTAINLSLDLPKTINSVHQNPFEFLKSLVFENKIVPKINLNEAKFKESLKEIEFQYTFLPTNATLETNQGKVITSKAKLGQKINWVKSIESLKNNWLKDNKNIQIYFDKIEPKINDEAVQAMRDSLAEAAVASPIYLKLDNQKVILRPAIIGSSLSFKEKENKFISEFNEKVIIREIENQLPNIEDNPVDARFEFIPDGIKIIPSKVGIKFKEGQLDAAMAPVFKQKNNREVNLDSAVIYPTVSTESLEKLGISEQLSSFTQEFEYLPYREKNVKKAAEYLNEKILAPGEVFSMNETIKERTKENGYVKGIYIGEGGRFSYGMGGGVSIITAATWSAAFYAGLEKIEQRAHSVLISRYTPGLEATVSWPKLDLKFRNNTKSHILIRAIPEKDRITISMYGTREYEKITAKFGKPYNLNNDIETVISYDSNCLAQDPAPGFKIKVTRQFWKNSLIIKSEDFLTSYRPSDHIICLKEGEVAPTTSPTPTIGGVEQPAPQSEITANS